MRLRPARSALLAGETEVNIRILVRSPTFFRPRSFDRSEVKAKSQCISAQFVYFCFVTLAKLRPWPGRSRPVRPSVKNIRPAYAQFVGMISTRDVTISTLTCDLCLGSLGVLWMIASPGGLPAVRRARNRVGATPATRLQVALHTSCDPTILSAEPPPCPNYNANLPVPIGRFQQSLTVSFQAHVGIWTRRGEIVRE